MPDDRPDHSHLRVDSLSQRRETPFSLEPDSAARMALADALGAQTIRKLRFTGTVSPHGRDSWKLDGLLGATVVQPCVVTLDPVTTRIDIPVQRRFVPVDQIESLATEETEKEMAEDDDSLEPLGSVIDLAEIMTEALALAMPSYPRKADLDGKEAQSAPQGVKPLSDEDAKPFAGLAALRDKLQGNGSEE